ncbi:MAG: tetratricopeptide repeat protein [Promethearchaeati archaeon]
MRNLIKKDKNQSAIVILNEIEEKEDLEQTELLNLYHYKATAFIRLGNYPETLKYAKKAYRIIRKKGLSSQLLESLIMLGHSSSWLGNFEKGYQYLNDSEQILNKLADLSEKRRIKYEAMICLSKNCGYMQKGKNERIYHLAMKVLNLSEQIDDKFVLAELYYQLASIYTFYKIDVKKAIKYSQSCQNLAEELENKTIIALNLVTMGSIYIMIGDLEKAFFYHKEALKNTDIFMIRMSIFNNLSMIYCQKGELNKALESLEKAFNIADNNKAPYMMISILTSIIEVLVLKNEAKIAENHLITLKDIAEKEKSKLAEIYANFCEALILKSKKRIQDHAKAQRIFEEIIQKEEYYGELTMKALINLCDLFIEEFRLTSELEVLEDLNQFLEKLLIIAEELNSFWILAETYLLQAKIVLLKGDLKATRKILIDAQHVAEEHDLKLLLGKISYEHDKILKSLKTWESLIENEAPLKERIELAELDVHIENMLFNRKKSLEISEEEPVIIFIISEGGNPLFSHSFIENLKYESHLFGGFLTTIDFFIKEMFSEGLDRAVFGDYTLLMKSISPFFITYVFKGDSYYALQRIGYFTEKIQKNTIIWNNLKKRFQQNRSLRLEDIPSFDLLLRSVFIEKNIPL